MATSRFLCIKIIDCNARKLSYNEHPLVTYSFFCIFLLVVSGTQEVGHTYSQQFFSKKEENIETKEELTCPCGACVFVSPPVGMCVVHLYPRQNVHADLPSFSAPSWLASCIAESPFSFWRQWSLGLWWKKIKTIKRSAKRNRMRTFSLELSLSINLPYSPTSHS